MRPGVPWPYCQQMLNVRINRKGRELKLNARMAVGLSVGGDVVLVCLGGFVCRSASEQLV
jgi:hypothetical protein